MHVLISTLHAGYSLVLLKILNRKKHYNQNVILIIDPPKPSLHFLAERLRTAHFETTWFPPFVVKRMVTALNSLFYAKALNSGNGGREQRAWWRPACSQALRIDLGIYVTWKVFLRVHSVYWPAGGGDPRSQTVGLYRGLWENCHISHLIYYLNNFENMSLWSQV